MELNFTNMVTLLATTTTPTPSAGAITYMAIFRVAPFHPQVFAFCLHVAALGVTVCCGEVFLMGTLLVSAGTVWGVVPKVDTTAPAPFVPLPPSAGAAASLAGPRSGPCNG